MTRYLRLLFLCLSACANLPPAIENAPLIDLSYGQVQQNIIHYKNAPVRWGGVILNIENKKPYSLAEVLLYPLNRYSRPNPDKSNQGRFLLKIPEFLDPAVYIARIQN